MARIKTYKDPKLSAMRKQQRECMQRLRAKKQQEILEKQRIEHNVIEGNKSIKTLNRYRREFKKL